MGFGLAEVGGHPRVVAAGTSGNVVLGDLDGGQWGTPLAGSQPHDDSEVMVDTGILNSAPIAVTCTTSTGNPCGTPDPDFTSVLHAWDLEGGHALGEPVAAHVGGALGAQLIEWEDRTVAVTVGRGDALVKVWALDW